MKCLVTIIVVIAAVTFTVNCLSDIPGQPEGRSDKVGQQQLEETAITTLELHLKENSEDHKDELRGFVCTYNSNSGTIRHPSSGSYTDNDDYMCIIRATSPINITFTSFNTESGYDYLRVRDGSSSGSTSLGYFTGCSLPSSVITSGKSAYLRFTSDGSVTGTGFQLSWNSFVATYNSNSGTIRHPSNGSYTNNEDYNWIIRASSPINITFTSFNTESGYDYLRVRDGSTNGSTSLGMFSGSSLPSSVITSGNTAYLRFTSDYSVIRTGFQLSWNVLMAPTTKVPTEAPTTETPTVAPTEPPTTTPHTQGCPVESGYMLIPGSNKCMKMFNETRRTWSAANQKCQDESMVMAETEDPVALRSYLMNTQGVTYHTWLGAKGDNSYVRWTSDNSIIASTSGYWLGSYNPHSGVCLLLLISQWDLTNYPTAPFYTATCTSTVYTLCELI